LVLGNAFLAGSLLGAAVFDVADGQPQQLDHGVVSGMYAPVIDTAYNPVTETIAVGR
jgi:hypothetical protein